MKNPRGGAPNTRLRDFRKQRLLTQADIARELGVTDLTVGRWERGEAVPSAYYIKKLCNFFETTPQMLGLVPQPEEGEADGRGTTNKDNNILSAHDLQGKEKSVFRLIEEEEPEAPSTRLVEQERGQQEVSVVRIPGGQRGVRQGVSRRVALIASGCAIALCVLLISLLVMPRLFPGGSDVAAKVATPTPTTLIDGAVHLSFEDGDTSYFNNVTKTLKPFGISEQYAEEGKKSVQFTYKNDVEEWYPYAFIGDSKIDRLGIDPPMKNQTLFAYVYLPPASSLSLTCKFAVIKQNSQWVTGTPIEIPKGKWTRLTIKVPEDHPDQIGVQFGGTGYGAVYVDAIGW